MGSKCEDRILTWLHFWIGHTPQASSRWRSKPWTSLFRAFMRGTILRGVVAVRNCTCVQDVKWPTKNISIPIKPTGFIKDSRQSWRKVEMKSSLIIKSRSMWLLSSQVVHTSQYTTVNLEEDISTISLMRTWYPQELETSGIKSIGHFGFRKPHNCCVQWLWNYSWQPTPPKLHQFWTGRFSAKTFKLNFSFTHDLMLSMLRPMRLMQTKIEAIMGIFNSVWSDIGIWVLCHKTKSWRGWSNAFRGQVLKKKSIQVRFLTAAVAIISEQWKGEKG